MPWFAHAASDGPSDHGGSSDGGDGTDTYSGGGATGTLRGQSSAPSVSCNAAGQNVVRVVRGVTNCSLANHGTLRVLVFSGNGPGDGSYGRGNAVAEARAVSCAGGQDDIVFNGTAGAKYTVEIQGHDDNGTNRRWAYTYDSATFIGMNCPVVLPTNSASTSGAATIDRITGEMQDTRPLNSRWLDLLDIGTSSLTSGFSVNDLLAQLDAIQSLIRSLQSGFDVDTTGSRPTSTGSTSCIDLLMNLSQDDNDDDTNGEVSRLQRFLGIEPTGYFGPTTEGLVGEWQIAREVVSSEDAGGYGRVGPKTRAAMACQS